MGWWSNDDDTKAGIACLSGLLRWPAGRNLGDKSRQATIDFQRAYMEQIAVDGIFGVVMEQRILDVIATGENTKESIKIDTWNASYASVYLHSNSYHHAMGVDVQLSHNL